MQYPRIELGSREWQSRILPLNQYCTLHIIYPYLAYLTITCTHFFPFFFSLGSLLIVKPEIYTIKRVEQEIRPIREKTYYLRTTSGTAVQNEQHTQS